MLHDPASAPDRDRELGEDVETLARFCARHRRLFVLTGAGISSASGIPQYRDDDGEWQHARPIDYRDFVAHEPARKRYWARAMIGWQRFSGATPNAAHLALAGLQRSGRVALLVTQNVDGLHQRAGTRGVLELHGRLRRVMCLGCRTTFPRQAVQQWLREHNPDFDARMLSLRPDGDAELGETDYGALTIPQCPVCAGLLKPDVVFFGEAVPRFRVTRAFAALERADAMLVIGSSLMVFSGYRFVRHATRIDKPVAAINLGRTRADDELTLKVRHRCGDVLEQLVSTLEETAPAP